MRLLAAALLGTIVAELSVACRPVAASVKFDLGGSALTLDDRGVASVKFADGSTLPGDGKPVFELKRAGAVVPLKSIQREGSQLRATFDQNAFATFTFSTHRGFVVFRLTDLSVPEDTNQLRLFLLSVPGGSEVGDTLNCAIVGSNFVTVQACELNVHAFPATASPAHGDRSGGSHEFELARDAKVGRRAARYSATSSSAPNGWSVHGRLFESSLNLTNCRAIRAWVFGDGRGELLKFQLLDYLGNYCDAYQKIDFRGWRQITLPVRPSESFASDKVLAINLYYNELPAGQTVTCLIDQIEAITGNDNRFKRVMLENFEKPNLAGWDMKRRALSAETTDRYGLKPAAFAVMACAASDVSSIMPDLERTAGLPSPRPRGVWNKQSPWIKQSYLFLTSFGTSQFDGAIEIARRGGFTTVLLGQESWCDSTGHYGIQKKNFPGGIKDLHNTVRKFQDAGFHVGLHFLAPSVYPPDRYLTPVPDKRLLKGVSALLATPISATDETLSLQALPIGFPAQDGGYNGEGTVIQINNELIQYASISKTAPGFEKCVRGYLNTRAAPHARGAVVRHLKRAYGYHMFDLDTNLAVEAAGRFAAMADGCGVDMVYFDGCERLQGDHWYYNPKLLKTFYDKFRKQDRLFQASSFSHYSWHMLARSASADGHGDLKGYLDERAPTFVNFARQRMPLDIGWYYGYDPDSTLDQYEYVLAQTLAYDSSMSFQVSIPAAERHPFTDGILDLISRYEKLRLSDRVSPKIRARLKVAPQLSGIKVKQQSPLLSHRREYRLLEEDGKESFQRVIYAPWQEIAANSADITEWTVEVSQKSRVGFQVHVRSGVLLGAGPSYHTKDAVVLDSFDDLAPWTADPRDSRIRTIEDGKGGSTSPGVRQRIMLRPGGKEGRTYALYFSESSLPNAQGWAVLSRSFDPPLNLSEHAAIGFWLLGDGKGGLFKLQLGDGSKLMDYYIKNDFTGWRYQQLERPNTDVINYRTVRSLMMYYNGIPANTKLNCGIDDIKAIRRVDRPTISTPWVKAQGQRLQVNQSVSAGQYLFAWPGEAIQMYPKAAGESVATMKTIELEPGSHRLRFGCDNSQKAPLRVRATLQPAERYDIGVD